MHLPVSLRRVSPTAMGLTSVSALLSLELFLFRAISLAPAKKGETDLGALPDAKTLTTPRRVAQIGEWRGTEAASSKCCTDSPEGPAEVPFGKNLRMWRMSKEGLSVTGSEDDTGDRGTGQEGCLSCNRCNVVSVIGAVPLDNKIRQALPSNPAWPRETAEETVRLVLLDVR